MQNFSFEFFIVPLEFIWLCLALLFLGAEIAAPGLFYCLAFALGCGVAALAAYLKASIVMQCLLSLTSATIAFIYLHLFIKKYHLAKKQFEKSATNGDALIGQEAIVIEPVGPHMRGLVKIRGELWPAQTHEHKIFTKDSLVTVVNLKGNYLLISS